MKLPAVHLSVDDLEQIETLLRKNTTKSEIELVLSLPGGAEQKLHSVDQLNDSFLTNINGSGSYSLSVTGKEGRCTIAGESTNTESHVLYCMGDSDWRGKIQSEIKSYFDSAQTKKSWFRGQLAGARATGVAVSAAVFVGWAASSISPQALVHYFPTLSDAFLFFIGTFGLLIVRYRNWVHPYIWIRHGRHHPTRSRVGMLAIAATLVTFVVLVFRWSAGPGPFLR